MKKISICVPCYNEEGNIELVYQRIKKILEMMPNYEYEIIFGDNCSIDSSKEILKKLALENRKVKVIFNNRNFGAVRSANNILFSAEGDAVIAIPCDLQEPPEMIPQFIEEWERGNLVVWGQKTKSRERKIKYACRKLYYKIIQFFSDIPQYEQVTGFGLMDKTVVDVIKGLDEPDMSIRHLVAELGYPVKLLPYTQEVRKNGKSSYNLQRYFDFAIISLTRTSTVPLHLITIFGFFCALVSLVFGIIYLVYKLLYWNAFSVGIAPMLIAVFFFGSIQLFSIGFIGEYIGVILTKVTKRPLVTEKERINFDRNEDIEESKKLSG